MSVLKSLVSATPLRVFERRSAISTDNGRARAVREARQWARTVQVSSEDLAFGLAAALSEHGPTALLLRQALKGRGAYRTTRIGGQTCMVWDDVDGVKVVVPRPSTPMAFNLVISALTDARSVVIEHDIPIHCEARIKEVWNGLKITIGPRQIHAPRLPAAPELAKKPHAQKVRAMRDEKKPIGRAFQRLARIVDGRAIGVALGGGGAWAFSHIALLRALEKQQVPIDFIAGHSMGAVIGGLYCARGDTALRALVRSRAQVVPSLLASTIRPSQLEHFLEKFVGQTRLENLETAFLPLTADLNAGEVFIPQGGRLSEVISATWRPPLLRAPHTSGNRRLAAGGLVSFMPVRDLREAGAAQIIASDVVPAQQASDRWSSQLLRSSHLVMRQLSRDQIREADMVVSLGDPRYRWIDYHKAPGIVSAAAGVLEKISFTSVKQQLWRASRRERRVA